VGDVQELSVYESYSGVRMIVTKALSAEFDVHTSFGSFHNDSEFDIEEEKEGDNDMGPRFDKDYTGKAGDGKARIKIKSSFGSVRLTHTASNANDKDEDRSRKKNKNKHKNKDKDNEDEDDNDNDNDSDEKTI
jgi:hypothetical protein